MSELETFLETPEEGAQEPVVTDPVTPDAAPTESKGKQDAAMPAAGKDESTANPAETGWERAAYHDEKRKRQERDEEVRQLREQLAKVQPPKQEPAKVDLFVDPDGFVKGIDEKIAQARKQDRVELSREFYLDLKPDFRDKEVRFIELTKLDPTLWDKMHASSNPAKFAYETAAQIMQMESKLKLMEDVGDIDQLREKIRAEVLAEQQGGSPPKSEVKQPRSIVEKAPSLATASAAKSNTTPSDDSLESLYPR